MLSHRQHAPQRLLPRGPKFLFLLRVRREVKVFAFVRFGYLLD